MVGRPAVAAAAGKEEGRAGVERSLAEGLGHSESSSAALVCALRACPATHHHPHTFAQTYTFQNKHVPCLQAVALSHDQTAEREDERARILAGGGSVVRRAGAWRVGEPGLAVTRCSLLVQLLPPPCLASAPASAPSQDRSLYLVCVLCALCDVTFLSPPLNTSLFVPPSPPARLQLHRRCRPEGRRRRECRGGGGGPGAGARPPRFPGAGQRRAMGRGQVGGWLF